MALGTSPSIHNYHIGKGVVSFKEASSPTFVDLGNAPAFVYTPKVTTKEHFSSRTGIMVKDFSVPTQVGATIKVTLDEITPENLAMFAMGTISTATAGGVNIGGLTKTQYSGILKVEGTNDIGQHVDWTGTVTLVPSGDFSFITDKDDFSTIVIDAEVQQNPDGSFGVWTVGETTTA